MSMETYIRNRIEAANPIIKILVDEKKEEEEKKKQKKNKGKGKGGKGKGKNKEKNPTGYFLSERVIQPKKLWDQLLKI